MSAEQATRLLVVEDNEPEQLSLCEILREEGYEPVGCGSAVEGLAHIGKGDFTVAVVDLCLPDLSGNQLLGLIRRIDDRIRVIIYTGAASFDTIKEAMSLGAFAYVEKLSDTGELLSTIRRACDPSADHVPTAGRAIMNHRAEPNRRAEKPAHSSQDLEEFASVVAHDLRSPLLTISGYSQLLGEEYRDRLDEDALEYLDRIMSGVTQANRLIEDLLGYSRVGRSDLPPTHVDLGSVMERVKTALEAKIQENHAELHVDRLPTVAGDEAQLVQLFQNLIDNALKFRGDADPIVHLCSTRRENAWEFAVEDNGIGLEEKHANEAFQIFRQFHGKKYSGTGIGLAVCNKVVQCHGGHIWLESTRGRGTTVRFTIPDRTDTLKSLVDRA